MSQTVARRIVAGRYRIVEPIGGGGTSLVFPRGGGGRRSRRRDQAAPPAVCRRPFAAPAVPARGGAGAPLDHPSIVRLLDAGEDSGLPFVVLDLMRGETLRQRLDRDGKLPAVEARSIFIQLARALDHAHGRGVIHRDVKPENIFITAAGVAGRLRQRARRVAGQRDRRQPDLGNPRVCRSGGVRARARRSAIRFLFAGRRAVRDVDRPASLVARGDAGAARRAPRTTYAASRRPASARRRSVHCLPAGVLARPIAPPRARTRSSVPCASGGEVIAMRPLLGLRGEAAAGRSAMPVVRSRRC